MRFFFFGSLRDQDVLRQVLGRPPPLHSLRAAVLPGHRLVCVRNEAFPMLLADAEGRVEGEVVEGLGAADMDRIRFFESVEYGIERVEVGLQSGDWIEAHIFASSGRAAHDDEPWDYVAWQREEKLELLRITDLWMQFYGLVGIDEADRLWDEAVAAGRPLRQVIDDLRATAVAGRGVGA